MLQATAALAFISERRDGTALRRLRLRSPPKRGRTTQNCWPWAHEGYSEVIVAVPPFRHSPRMAGATASSGRLAVVDHPCQSTGGGHKVFERRGALALGPRAAITREGLARSDESSSPVR